MKTLDYAKLNFSNILGKKSSDKIVVFESDDWGMIRTSSLHSYNRLLKKGYHVDKCIYNKNDSLESNEDIEKLVEVLHKHSDKNDLPAKFTLNNVVANPDFKKIKANGYLEYYYEPFTKTLEKYNNTSKVLELYKEGVSKNIFKPQFHGREHVNINRWLGELESRNQRFLDAFEENQFTVAGQGRTSGRKDYLDAFGRAYINEYESEESIIKTGLDLFEEIWGYRSKSFIAPCYIWSPEIEKYLINGGVKYIQGTHVQRIPIEGLDLQIKKKYQWQGKKNKSGLKSIVRNVMFEPTEHNSAPSSVDQAMAQIKNAFFWNKPAVISTHRVNYIGRLNPENRDKNLRLLDQLLTQILKKYPDVIFMSSDELGELYDR